MIDVVAKEMYEMVINKKDSLYFVEVMEDMRFKKKPLWRASQEGDEKGEGLLAQEG